MNILFFLTPKSEVAYIFENETLRQTLEKMEHRKFWRSMPDEVQGRSSGIRAKIKELSKVFLKFLAGLNDQIIMHFVIRMITGCRLK